MKKVLLMLIIVLLLSVSIVAIAAADDGQAHGDCPSEKWTPHKWVNHDQHTHDGNHKHVGNDKDLNGDGWICGKHVGKNGDVHVHIDNNVHFND